MLIDGELEARIWVWIPKNQEDFPLTSIPNAFHLTGNYNCSVRTCVSVVTGGTSGTSASGSVCWRGYPSCTIGCRLRRMSGAPVRDGLWHARVLGGKAFMGEDGPQFYQETRHLDILTPCRAHPHTTRPVSFQRWRYGLRARIARAFHEIPNTGHHLEHLRCETVRGLADACHSQDDPPCP